MANKTTNTSKTKIAAPSKLRMGWLGRMSKTRLFVAAGMIAVFSGLGTYMVTQSRAGTACRTVVLQQGSKGHCVRVLQTWLGPQVVGEFGPKTRASVISFQRAQSLPATGTVANLTWSAICRQLHYNRRIAPQMARDIGCFYVARSNTWQ